MFKDRIRNARLLRGYTQEEFAEVLGMSKNQVSRYERGSNDPTGESLIKIAQALDVSVDYLLGLSDVFDPYQGAGLSDKEKKAISAWRYGDKVDAVRTIVNDE